MAVFKVPRITTALRQDLLLEEAEIVYDVDLKKFFGGDGVTVGGVEFCYCSPQNFGNFILAQNGNPLITQNGNYIVLNPPSNMAMENGDIMTTENQEIIEV